MTEAHLEPQAADPADQADLTELLDHVHASWDEERRLLARQLHDSLGSSLTALTMHLALLSQHLPPDKALQDRAALMKQLLLKVIGANRQTQAAIWNDKLEFLGIKAALSDLASQFGEEHGCQVDLRLPEEELDCPRAVGIVLLRCVEEGLRNIAAHAPGARVLALTLARRADGLLLSLRDNGPGPGDAGVGDLGRHGLRLLRQRAASLGGSVALSQASGGGSCLTLFLPAAALNSVS